MVKSSIKLGYHYIRLIADVASYLAKRALGDLYLLFTKGINTLSRDRETESGRDMNLLHGTRFLNIPCIFSSPDNHPLLVQFNSNPYYCNYSGFQKHQGSWAEVKYYKKCTSHYKAKICNGREVDAFPDVQTLRKFPYDEIFGKVVMVRFDSNILLKKELDMKTQSVINSVSTIKYLYEAGAKVILVSSWSVKSNAEKLEVESVADFLSSALQVKVGPRKCHFESTKLKVEKEIENSEIVLLENLSEFKEELSNCSKFAKQLAKGVDIFVNDAFSQSHRILASTVGVSRFCSTCLAGFHFEEGISQLKKAIDIDRKPYIGIVMETASPFLELRLRSSKPPRTAVVGGALCTWLPFFHFVTNDLKMIGGGNFRDKTAALEVLACKCDGLIFIGNMAFQIMNALGLPARSEFVEHGAFEGALNIVEFARVNKVGIMFPKDFWCMNDYSPKQLELFPYSDIPDGWVPVDIGPNSLKEINTLLSKCRKLLWIGPPNFKLTNQHTYGESNLVLMLHKLSQQNCDITVIGKRACREIANKSNFVSGFNMIESGSVVWEFLKGRKLPGLLALDRAYPFEIDWNVAYRDPTQPLVVDIGSGNGLFLLAMAQRRKELNFLGLEINEKLVKRCLNYAHQSDINNSHFISTNATSTFRPIVSSYPGQLICVSIQCPNPDFTKPDHRWRMLQRSLVEAIADLLACSGKVFLQSDIEAVAVRMKEEFVRYSKGMLAVEHGEWLEENPFVVRSDWERHVLDRGGQMYRLMLCKSNCCHTN